MNTTHAIPRQHATRRARVQAQRSRLNSIRIVAAAIDDALEFVKQFRRVLANVWLAGFRERQPRMRIRWKPDARGPQQRPVLGPDLVMAAFQPVHVHGSTLR